MAEYVKQATWLLWKEPIDIAAVALGSVCRLKDRMVVRMTGGATGFDMFFLSADSAACRAVSMLFQ